MKTLYFYSIVILIALIINGCAKDIPVDTPNAEVICVKAETLNEIKATLPIQCTGSLSSKHLIRLSFKTGGIISRISADEGSMVKKGQVMATLEMTEISSQVEQSLLALAKAERDLNRIKSLYADTVATLEQLQDATSAYEAAVENRNIAVFNQRYSRIIAPSDGKIIARLAEEHELIGPGMPVLVFIGQGNEEWVVKAGLSDKDIVKVRKGDKAKAVFDAFPGKTFTAFVSQVSEAVDPQSGTFEIEVTFLAEEERMINGLVAKLAIETESSNVVTMVPPEALIEVDGSQGFVYVVEKTDTTARKVAVTLAYLENDKIAVLESFNKIGPVITEGASYLEDGSKITITK